MKTTPYFYIIQEKSTGRKYAGCRWAPRCDPTELLTENGYNTSSKIVNSIIKENGINSFQIVEIKTEDEIGDVYEYETKFLKENNVGESDEWINQHDNSNFFSTQKILEQHGVLYHAQRKDVKNKISSSGRTKSTIQKKKDTCNKNYGVDSPLQSNEIKEKVKLTCIEKYGTNNPMKNKTIKNKAIASTKEKYGVDHPMQSKEILEKSIETCMEKYGVARYSQTEECKEKVKNSYMTHYGVDHPMKDKNFQEKLKKLSMEKYGVDNPMKHPDIKKKISDAALKRFEDRSKIPAIGSMWMTLENVHITKCKEKDFNFLTTLGYIKKRDKNLPFKKLTDIYLDQLQK